MATFWATFYASGLPDYKTLLAFKNSLKVFNQILSHEIVGGEREGDVGPVSGPSLQVKVEDVVNLVKLKLL